MGWLATRRLARLGASARPEKGKNGGEKLTNTNTYGWTRLTDGIAGLWVDESDLRLCFFATVFDDA